MKKQLNNFNFQAAGLSSRNCPETEIRLQKAAPLSPGLFPSLTASSSQATATEGRAFAEG